MDTGGSPQRVASPDLPDPAVLVAAAEANTKRAEAALARAEVEAAQAAATAHAQMLEERAGRLREQELRLNAQQELLTVQQGEHSEESLPPAEPHDSDLPVPHDGKSTLKFVEPKKFSGSEDSRPIDVFLDSAERWLRFGAKSPPPVEQWAMYASSLLTGQAEKQFSVVSRQSAIDLADMSWAKFCSIMKGAYSRIEQDFAARVEFHEIEQKHDQDVNSLVRTMRELISKMDELPDPKTQAFTLVGALREDIRKATMRLAPRGGSWASFDEAAEAAVIAEADLRRNRLLSRGTKSQGQYDSKRSDDRKRSNNSPFARSGKRDDHSREGSRGNDAGMAHGGHAGGRWWRTPWRRLRRQI